MNLSHRILRSIPHLLLGMLGIGAISCSEDIPGNGGGDFPRVNIPVKIIAKDLTASTRALSTSPTRDLASFEATAEDNELIHSCTVGFVTTGGKVAVVQQLPENTTGVESQEFTVNLSADDYSVYAFANFEAPADLGLTKENQITISSLHEALYDVKANDLTSTDNIPMSGYLTDITVSTTGSVTVGGTESKDISIPVVRMVGKMEFSFINKSDSPITITEISVKPGATGEITLLPVLPTLATPAKTTDDNSFTITRNPEDFTVANTEGANTNSFSFYLREVTSGHPTGSFPITIKYRNGDSGTVQEMTALLYDLTTINRNDWVRVPITLTDRKLKLDVDFYPPIGGYPPVEWVDMDDEYYVTFATGGWFSIRPIVLEKGKTDADGNQTAVDPANVSINVTDVSNTAFFRKQPGVENSGEFTGEIASGLDEGATSVVTIEITLTDTEADGTTPITSETFKRKIHFIRK